MWKKDQRGREACNSRGRPSCQIVVDLFLFNLLTPRVTLYPSPSLHFSFSRRENPWPLGSRVSREKSMPEGPGRRISRRGERRPGSARAASNRKRRRAEKTNCGSRGKRIICAGDLYSPAVSDRFAANEIQTR